MAHRYGADARAGAHAHNARDAMQGAESGVTHSETALLQTSVDGVDGSPTRIAAERLSARPGVPPRSHANAHTAARPSHLAAPPIVVLADGDIPLPPGYASDATHASHGVEECEVGSPTPLLPADARAGHSDAPHAVTRTLTQASDSARTDPSAVSGIRPGVVAATWADKSGTAKPRYGRGGTVDRATAQRQTGGDRADSPPWMASADSPGGESPEGPTPVFEVPLIGLNPIFAKERAPTVQQLASTFSFVMPIVVFYPFCLLVLPFVIGWNSTVYTMSNLCFFLRREDFVNRDRFASHRWQVWLFHQLTTLTLFLSVIAWGTTFINSGNKYDTEAELVAWHMAWLQMVTTLLNVLPRRFALSAAITTNINLAPSTYPKQLKSQHISAGVVFAHSVIPFGTAYPAVVLRNGLDHIYGDPSAHVWGGVITEAGYRAVTRFVKELGTPQSMPPLDSVKMHHGGLLTMDDDESTPLLVCSSGNFSSRCTTKRSLASNAGDDVFSPSMAASAASVGSDAATMVQHLATGAATHALFADVRRMRRVLLDMHIASNLHKPGAASAMYNMRFAFTVPFLGTVMNIVIPFVIRRTLRVPLLGSNAAEASVFLLLPLCEVLCMLAPTLNGALQTQFQYQYLTAALDNLLLMHAVPSSVSLSVEEISRREEDEERRKSIITVDSERPRVQLVPDPYGEPDDRAVASVGAMFKLGEKPREDFHGIFPLDSVPGLVCAGVAARQLIKGMDCPAMSHPARMAAIAPFTSVIVSVVLAIVFTVSPDTLASATAISGGAFKLAAITPTAVVLVNFLVNGSLLFMAFRSAARALEMLQKLQALALRWKWRTSEQMLALSAERELLSHQSDASANATRKRQVRRASVRLGAGVQAYSPEAARVSPVSPALADVSQTSTGVVAAHSGVKPGPSPQLEQQPSFEDALDPIDPTLARRREVERKLRDTHSVIDALETLYQEYGMLGQELRFLGLFQPGNATVGGMAAILASAGALALRLANAVYGSRTG